MNLEKFFGITFGATLLSASLSAGISYGANGSEVTSTTASTTTITAPGTTPVSGAGANTPNSTGATQIAPELHSAADRVDMSRSKLDQARQQLSAAKAMLKAAEAEYRAARADQEALSLRSEARKLADASGLQESTSTGTRLYPVDMSQLKTAPVTTSVTGNNMLDASNDNRLQSNDMSGVSPIPPQSGAPTP